MDKITLFPTELFKSRIDPKSYDKERLIEEIEKNYDIDSRRNRINIESTSHHYYFDWENQFFNKLDLSKLRVQYEIVIKDFMNRISFDREIRYSYDVANIHVSKSFQRMGIHDHLESFYSAAHYISLKEEHQLTRFHNPLILGHYPSLHRNVKMSMANSIENSAYFEAWTIPLAEDDILFFPSYLKHDVLELIGNTDKLRIVAAINIDIS